MLPAADANKNHWSIRAAFDVFATQPFYTLSSATARRKQARPADYDRVVGLMTLPGRTPREYHTLKQHGMFGGTMKDPPELQVDE